MILTKDQASALEGLKALAKFEKIPKVFVLAGFAGSGKTTLLKLLCEELGPPIAVAPSGKAAQRIREVTELPATTIHSWLYTVEENTLTGELSFVLKEPSEIKTSDQPPLICIDEASMVDADLWEDIYDTCVRMRMNILCIGDPFQLPPVKQDPDARVPFNIVSEHFECDKRFELNEIVRQALDSPIIRSSMEIRTGDPASAILRLPKVSNSSLTEAIGALYQNNRGAFICHKNSTRQQGNQAVRASLGYDKGVISALEPLLVLENDPFLQISNGEKINFVAFEELGSPREINDRISSTKAITAFGRALLDMGNKIYKKAIISDAQVLCTLPDKFSTYVLRKNAEIAFMLNRDLSRMTEEERARYMKEPRFLSATLGYVMTCHKAQGSEWPEVIIGLEPSVQMKSDDGRRWLYTAVTRAKEKVSVCLGPKF